jgi:DeoR/GlpR family transcriptional regulator of sugar metabolism
VILDGGSTTLEVARRLPAELVATVVTHSPTVAAALVEHPRVEIFLIGGRVFKHSAVASGAAAVEAAAGVNADLFLLGVTGIHPHAGLTTGDSDEAAMKRALADAPPTPTCSAAKRRSARRHSSRCCPSTKSRVVITDADPSNPTVSELLRRGVPILQATKDSGSHS